ncbi:hypothetical protein HMPREF3037_02586 [Candidatus Stoquefichus sp. KLE1796]|nr:hypothetical protein HMPREF3037_02586 [Candidatus Stoquefichus sp. KLE1796]
MKLKKKVVDIMEKKADDFNEDMILQDMAFNRDLNKRARQARMKRERDEGKEEGLQEGLSKGLRYSVLKLFIKTYPQAETGFLENLSVEQYEKIFDLLIEKASLEKIYQIAKKKIR